MNWWQRFKRVLGHRDAAAEYEELTRRPRTELEATRGPGYGRQVPPTDEVQLDPRPLDLAERAIAASQVEAAADLGKPVKWAPSEGGPRYYLRPGAGVVHLSSEAAASRALCGIAVEGPAALRIRDSTVCGRCRRIVDGQNFTRATA